MKKNVKRLLIVLKVIFVVWTLCIIIPETRLYRVEATVNGNENGKYRLHLIYKDANNFPQTLSSEFVFNVKVKSKVDKDSGRTNVAYVWIPLKYMTQDLTYVLTNN